MLLERTRNRILLAVIISTACLAAILFWIRSAKQIRPGQFRDANIVLITIDTLRADHLPAHGYTRVKTPAIDRFAAESVLFEDAVAHAPMTLPSHASILTGLLPPFHGVHDNAGFTLQPETRTLPEILKDHGYQTAAFVSAFVLDSQFRLDQGFDLYSDDFTLAEARVSSLDLYRRAADTQVEVDDWLQKNIRRKFFLWVHYYDPHDPYEPPEPYRTTYAGSLYDGEIAYTDEVIGKLMKRLDDAPLKENTIVILTSDHGEGLGEHNERTHSLFIYNATQHVPLMFRLPKTEARRVQQVAGHVDIAPTILDLVGIAPDPQMQGQSLIPALVGKRGTAGTEYSESLLSELHYGWSPLRGITSNEYRFIEAPRPELYDRRTDRSELKNIAPQMPGIVGDFRKQLNALLRAAPQRAATPAGIDPETEEKLKALGYVGTTVQGTPESRKIDPKDRIQVLNAISVASAAMDAKNYSAALGILTPVLQQEPQLVDAHYMAANAHLHLGQYDLALREFQETIRLKPDHAQSLYNLAYYYHSQGNLPAAEHWYKELLKVEPGHLFGNLNLASLYRQLGQDEKAAPLITKMIADYDRSIRATASPRIRSRLLEKVSEIRYKTGDTQQSLRDLEEATKADPENEQAWWKLGSLYRKQERIPDAIDCFRNAISANKEFYPAYFALSEAYLKANTNLAEALQLAETANEKRPGPEAERLLAALRARLK